jgi:ferritin-like metal-binding protein YciE
MIHQLRDLLSSSRQMSMLLPKMADLAHNEKLKELFNERGERSERHQELIRECLELMGAPRTPETCHAMIGLITEGDHLLSEVSDPEVRDAALIVTAQRIQHYEIAGYGTAKCHAEQLDERNVAEKIDVILKEEKKLDKRLSKLAESSVNEKALATA